VGRLTKIDGEAWLPDDPQEEKEEREADVTYK
jgi:hypothetical protein